MLRARETAGGELISVRRSLISAFFALTGASAVQHPAIDAPKLSSAEYLYLACEHTSFTQPPIETATVNDANFCAGSLVMLLPALTSLHIFYEARFKNKIDARNDKEEAARYILMTSAIGADACPPGDISVNTASLIVVKFGREHPEALSWTAFQFAGMAFQSTYPCNRLKY